MFVCCKDCVGDFVVKIMSGEASLKKNRKIWEKFPKGGGVKKTDENSQFQFGNLKNLGGVLNFSKMSEFQLFNSVVCNITFIRNV